MIPGIYVGAEDSSPRIMLRGYKETQTFDEQKVYTFNTINYGWIILTMAGRLSKVN
jgi:hypothetical protein